MTFIVRTETPEDYPGTEALIRVAFASVKESDGSEPAMVSRLRESPHFIAELSLIAQSNGKVIGHILFSPIEIIHEDGSASTVLALAPVSVLPQWQKNGVGKALIEEGHRRAASLGFKSIIVLGHAEYYPRFGYEPASKWKVKAPFDVPDNCFMALELVESGLRKIGGVVKYPLEFGIS